MRKIILGLQNGYFRVDFISSFIRLCVILLTNFLPYLAVVKISKINPCDQFQLGLAEYRTCSVHTTAAFALYNIGFSVGSMSVCQRVTNRFHTVRLITRRKLCPITQEITIYISLYFRKHKK